MAFKFTNIIPVWKNKGLAPEEEIQNTGFRGGYKPPAHIFNWFWHLVSSAIGELQGKVEEVNGDYLSKSQGGTVEGKVTFSKDTTFESNAEVKKKLTVDKESEFKGTVTAKGLKCGEATFSGTLRAEKGLKAAQIEATDDENSRVGKEKEPYKDIYGVDLHAENLEVSGTITNTDLKNKLDGKANVTHTHKIGDVTDLQKTLDGKANKTHTHQSADITDLQEKLNGKANTSHKHLSSDITDLQATLDGKAAKEHTHTSSQVTDLDATIQAAISKADHLKRQIVTSLPAAGDEHIIYMMKKTGGTGNDVYDEYMWIDNKFELIGNSKVDLTGYAKSTDLESYLKKTEEAASAGKVAHKLSISQNGGDATEYDGSADAEVDITAESIGAATADHVHPDIELDKYGHGASGFMSSTDKRNLEFLLISGEKNVDNGFNLDITNSRPSPTEHDNFGDNLIEKFKKYEQFHYHYPNNDIWYEIYSSTVYHEDFFSLIHVGDYVPVEINDGISTSTYHAQVIGKNTEPPFMRDDSHGGSQFLGSFNHIDFCFRECLHFSSAWSAATDNNGTAEEGAPYLRSSIYSFYEKTIFPLLPPELRELIIPKTTFSETRFQDGTTLDRSNGSKPKVSFGHVWTPTEFEVFGTTIFGTQGFSEQLAYQYPLFRMPQQRPHGVFALPYNGEWEHYGYGYLTTHDRLEDGKTANDRGIVYADETAYWLATPSAGSTNKACCINMYGQPGEAEITKKLLLPVCFRIGASDAAQS